MQLFEDVGTRPEDIAKYLEAQKRHYARRSGKDDWNALDTREKTKAAHDLCSSLYQDLSIVDAKAGGLIASNAIVTAIFALVSLTPPGPGPAHAAPGLMWLASTGFVIVSLAALILNVSVLHLYWLTTEQIHEESDPDKDPFLRAIGLVKRRNRRTKRYRIAYRLHLGLLALALLMFVGLLLGAFIWGR
jgi:hypothetical protein